MRFSYFGELHCSIIAQETLKFKAFSHLSRRTLRPIHRRTFFGFTKVLVVRVAAPQLLAGVVGSKLNEETAIMEKSVSKQTHSFSFFMLQEENPSFYIPMRELHSWLSLWACRKTSISLIVSLKRDLTYYFQAIPRVKTSLCVCLMCYYVHYVILLTSSQDGSKDNNIFIFIHLVMCPTLVDHNISGMDLIYRCSGSRWDQTF